MEDIKVVLNKMNPNVIKMNESKLLFKEYEKYILEALKSLKLKKNSFYNFISKEVGSSEHSIQKSFKDKKLPKKYLKIIEFFLFSSNYHEIFFEISFDFYMDKDISLGSKNFEELKNKGENYFFYWEKWLKLVKNKKSLEFDSKKIIDDFKTEFEEIKKTSLSEFKDNKISDYIEVLNFKNFTEEIQKIKERIFILEGFYRILFCLVYVSRLKRYFKTDFSRKENHDLDKNTEEIFQIGENILEELEVKITKDNLEFLETLELLKLNFYGNRSIYDFSWEYANFPIDKFEEVIKKSKFHLGNVKPNLKKNIIYKVWTSLYNFYVLQKEIELELKKENYLNCIDLIDDGINLLLQIQKNCRSSFTRIHLKTIYHKRDLEFKKTSLEAYILEQNTEGVFRKNFDNWDSFSYDEDMKQQLSKMIEIRTKIKKIPQHKG